MTQTQTVIVVIVLAIAAILMIKVFPDVSDTIGFTTADEYAQKYQLTNFAGMDVSYQHPDQLDIYGTLQTIETDTAVLVVVLVAPDYLIDSPLGAKRALLKNKFAKTVKIWLETETKFFDPYTANHPVTFAEIKNTKDKRILTTFTGAYVHIRARVNDLGKLSAEDIAIATIQ